MTDAERELLLRLAAIVADDPRVRTLMAQVRAEAPRPEENAR